MGKHTAIITDVRFRMSLAIIRDIAKTDAKIIAVEFDKKTPPLGFYSKYVSESVMMNKDTYLDELYQLCEREYKENGEKPALLTVSPATTDLFMSDSVRSRFSEVAGFCISSKHNLDLLNDKSALALRARSLGILVPEVYHAPFDDVVYPCVVKPSCGEKYQLKAWDRYRIVSNRQELDKAVKDYKVICNSQMPIVQQYIEGKGLGCSILSKDGEVLSIISHERVREYPISGGPSTCCKTVHVRELELAVKYIVSDLRYTGIAMFEFKQSKDGRCYLLECNPRVWGSYPLVRAASSNLTIKWYKECLKNGDRNIDVEIPKMKIHDAKMHYVLSDLVSGIGYIKNGKASLGLGAFIDALNPNVRGGLFEWSDIRPSLIYLGSCLKKKK